MKKKKQELNTVKVFEKKRFLLFTCNKILNRCKKENLNNGLGHFISRLSQVRQALKLGFGSLSLIMNSY